MPCPSRRGYARFLRSPCLVAFFKVPVGEIELEELRFKALMKFLLQLLEELRKGGKSLCTSPVIRLKKLLHDPEEPIRNLGVGVSGLEAKPDDLVEDAKVHQQPMDNVRHVADVVTAAVAGVGCERSAVCIFTPSNSYYSFSLREGK